MADDSSALAVAEPLPAKLMTAAASLLRLKRPRQADAPPADVIAITADAGSSAVVDEREDSSMRKRARLVFRRVDAPGPSDRVPRPAPKPAHETARAAWRQRAAMVDGWYDAAFATSSREIAESDGAAARRGRDAAADVASRSRIFARRRQPVDTSTDAPTFNATDGAASSVSSVPVRMYELVSSAPLGATVAAAASLAATPTPILIHRLPPGYRSASAAAVTARTSCKLITTPAPGRVLPPVIAHMCSCIRIAVDSGDLAPLKAAISAGGDVNTQCVRDDLSTPLMAAVGANDTRFALQLVRNGALARARNAAGDTAADIARRRGCIPLAHVLAGVAADEEAELAASQGRIVLTPAREDEYDTYELMEAAPVADDVGTVTRLDIGVDVLQELQRVFTRGDDREADDEAAIAEVEADAYMYEEAEDDIDDDGEGSIDENDERYDGNDYPEEEGVVPSTGRGAAAHTVTAGYAGRDIIQLDDVHSSVRPGAVAAAALHCDVGCDPPEASGLPAATYDIDDDDDAAGVGGIADDADDDGEEGSDADDAASLDDDVPARDGRPRWRDVRRCDEFEEQVSAEDMAELQSMLARLQASF